MLKVTSDNIDSFKVRSYLKWLTFKYSFGKGDRLFLDCGSNLGQGFEFFKDFFLLDKYDFVLFEPNPHCIKVLKEKYKSFPSIEIVQKAVWIDNSKLSFYGLVEDERGETSTGGSVIDKHNSSMYVSNKESSLEVDAFSFSDYIINKAKSYSKIIVKLDIESAEYKVLQDLINTKAINHISHIFIEFHSQYFLDKEREEFVMLEKSLISKLKTLNIGVSLWV